MSAEQSGLKKWLWKNRDSKRIGFLMQMAKRLANAFSNLIWTRLLIGLMGKEVYSLFLGFSKIFSFGDLGDLGMGGAIALRVGQHLGGEKTPEKEAEIKKFLSCARALFLLLAVCIATTVVAASPFWLKFMGFENFPDVGSLVMVAVVGGFMMIQVMLMSYASNLNYACGNVVWPVVPSIILLQLALAGHVLLARNHAPLWMQFIPYACCSYSELALMFFYIRKSFPQFAHAFPFSFNPALAKLLLGSSFWVYLSSLGNKIYVSTDQFVINAGSGRGIFPLKTTTEYTTNYKFCELVVFVVLTASFVSLPKITQLMASPTPEDKARVRVEMKRLNQFQTLLGCGAALFYLAANDTFMHLWWLKSHDPVPPAAVLLQVAFALNLAVTTSGDAAIQLSMRTGQRGLRVVGLVVALTGVLNLGLSVMAMKFGFLAGIALATVVAQTILSIFASNFICREMKLEWSPWVLRGCIIPLFGIAFAGWLRAQWPLDTVAHTIGLLSVYVALMVFGALGLGINREFIRREYQMLLRTIGR